VEDVDTAPAVAGAVYRVQARSVVALFVRVVATAGGISPTPARAA